MKYIFFCTFLIILPRIVLAQIINADTITTIVIQDSISTINSSTNLEEKIVNTSTAIDFRNISPGASMTVSLRGGTSSQTSVYWNNIPLANGMIGQSDLSLLPFEFFDDFSIDFLQQNSPIIQQSISGNITTRSEVFNHPGFHSAIDVEFGSFGFVKTNAGLNYSNKRLSFGIKGLTETATNNYPYSTKNNTTVRFQEHASYSNQAFMAQLGYQISTSQSIECMYWNQEFNRNLPPTTTQTISQASQRDIIHRSAINYANRFNNWIITTDLGYNYDNIQYTDSLIGQDARSSFTQLFLGQNIGKSFGIHRLLFQNNITNHKGKIDNYENGSVNRLEYLTQLQDQLKFGRHSLLLATSSRFTSTLGPSLLGLAEWQSNPSNNFKWLLATRYSNRLPSLNDLYWRPGGNLELKPEKSVNTSAELNYSSTRWMTKIAAFHTLTNDLILWHKNPDDFFFSPANISQVRGLGSEISLQYIQPLRSTDRLQFSTSYDVTRSTVLKNIFLPTLKKGDQLWYTPLHKVFTSITYNLNSFKGILSYSYQSPTKGINEDIDAFSLMDASITYNLNIKSTKSRITFQANNITNTQYNRIERRPLPGRNFRIKLNWRFN